MDVACPGNPPFGRSRPPLVAGAGGGEVVGAQRVSSARVVSQATRTGRAREGADASFRARGSARIVGAPGLSRTCHVPAGEPAHSDGSRVTRSAAPIP